MGFLLVGASLVVCQYWCNRLPGKIHPQNDMIKCGLQNDILFVE